MFAATRSRRGGLALSVALLCACAAAPAWGAVPGGYAVQRIDGPTPGTGDAFGHRLLAPGDLNGDQVGDLVIASPGAENGEGEVIAVSGSSGIPIWKGDGILRPADPASDAAETPSRLGTALAVFTDISGCRSGGGPQAPGDNCLSPTSPDGVPELLVSAPGADLSPGAKEVGRVYVVDGASGAIAKRVQLDPVDGLPSDRKVEFGSSVLMVPDVNGGGRPDIAVGAPGWSDNFDSNLDCRQPATPDLATCRQAGRVFVFSTEGAANLLQREVDISNTFAQDDTSAPSGTEPERFGAALVDIGDVGKCSNPAGANANCLEPAPGDNSPSNVPDEVNDYLVSAPQFDHDTAVRDSGAAFVVDGASAKIIRKIDPPAPPQNGGHFGELTYHPPRVGNVGASGLPDVYVAAPAHTGDFGGQGRAYLFDGDVFGSTVLATLNDPAPFSDGGFGAVASGVASGGIAIGAPFGERAGSVRIFDPVAAGTLAQTVCDPDGQSGAEFGAAIATLGDVNADGFDELAIGAPGFDHTGAANAGRVYIFTSKGPAASGSPGDCVSTGGGGGGAGGGGAGGGDGGAAEGGGGDEFDFANDDTVVTARVLRRLVMKPSRKRVRKFASFRLRGTLKASANRAVCQRRQKIALQRRKAAGGRFQTFEVAVTRASGKFTARAIAERTYLYRARVSQTSRCMGAVSKRAKVSVLRKRGAR